MHFGNLSVLLILLFLSSCFSKYEDRYTFIPPSGADEKICTDRCLSQRTQCLNRCLERKRVNDVSGRDIVLFEQDSETSSNKECNDICKESHVMCYRNCGGQVVVERVCAKFCKRLF